MSKDKKKHDLRDEVPARTSITNTESRMAGGADNPTMSTVDQTPLKRPAPAQRQPDGNDVADS